MGGVDTKPLQNVLRIGKEFTNASFVEGLARFICQLRLPQSKTRVPLSHRSLFCHSIAEIMIDVIPFGEFISQTL